MWGLTIIPDLVTATARRFGVSPTAATTSTPRHRRGRWYCRWTDIRSDRETVRLVDHPWLADGQRVTLPLVAAGLRETKAVLSKAIEATRMTDKFLGKTCLEPTKICCGQAPQGQSFHCAIFQLLGPLSGRNRYRDRRCLCCNGNSLPCCRNRWSSR